MNVLLNTAMKLNARKRKAQQGFTLVEVIVVAVIVAALAGVAIPLYLNYVTSSRTNAASNVAGSAASFVGACINGGGTPAGYTAATAFTAGTLTCTNGNGNGTTMTTPGDISVTITTTSSPGQVTAVHTATGSVASPAYRF